MDSKYYWAAEYCHSNFGCYKDSFGGRFPDEVARMIELFFEKNPYSRNCCVTYPSRNVVFCREGSIAI